MSQVLEIDLSIRCFNLPGVEIGEHKAVRLGIQKGQEVVDDVAACAEEAVFIAPLRVEIRADGTPNFLGPFAHGTPRERFIYLCWGERYGSHWAGFGRIKLQLIPISLALLFRASDSGVPLQVRISMTDDKGKPIFATVKEKQLSWQ